MKKSNAWIFKLTLTLSGIGIATTSFMGMGGSNGNRTEEIKQLPEKEIVTDFRKMAKIAIPAVVSIKVKGNTKRGSAIRGQKDDPFDLFGGGDLWNFFDIPHLGREPLSKAFEGQASGVIVSPDGYILTNSHVVHGMDKITVQLSDGRELPAKVLGDDTNSELALIKIEGHNFPFLSLGNSDLLEVGEPVAAIGNPFGLQATLTTGVVSAKSRNNLDIARYEDFIQTDAAINRGNSGGPLVTLYGEVVGINTAIATTSASGYVGIGFAIPSNMAKRFMDEILSNGKISRGFLGISLQSIDYNLARAFGLKKAEGALITNVSKNSAAEKAGLQVEDIILAIDGRPVENAASLRNAVYMLRPGTKANLTVLRKDRQIQVPVLVGEYTETAAAVQTSTKNQLGFEVSNLTPDLADRLGTDFGVVVTGVNPSTIAAHAGLKKGAVILGVNRQKITSVEEFNQAIANTPQDEPILLQIKQGDIYLFLSLPHSNEEK